MLDTQQDNFKYFPRTCNDINVQIRQWYLNINKKSNKLTIKGQLLKFVFTLHEMPIMWKVYITCLTL